MHRVHPRTLIGAAAAAALLAVPASASAMIQIDKGIAGARLNNTQGQVKAALGKPAKVKHGTNDFGKFTQFVYAGQLTVSFQGNAKVTSVSEKGKGDRTASGVGVGSKEAAVKKLKGIKCETFDGSRECHTNSFVAGKRVTDFFIRRGKVTRVDIGFVLD
jgi:hypothetical protein